MATPEQQPNLTFGPEDMMVALDRLRDAVFLAKDEAGRTGTVDIARCRELALLSAHVYFISCRLSENKATA